MPPAPGPNVQPFQEGSVLRALRGTFRNPRVILTGLGALGVSYAQASFVDQRLGGVRWKTRGETKMNPNWPAIVSDYNLGRRNIPARRFQDAPVLVDKGHLSKSVAFQVLGTDRVEIGSRLPYAGPLHAGEPTQSPLITEGFQKWLYGLIKKARGQVDSASKAPERRERKEAREARKADPELQRLEADVARSKAAYAGSTVPKGERERLARVRAQIKARRIEVERVARAASVEVTDREAARYGGAARRAAAMESLRWLLNPHLRGTTRTIKHPARPIVGVPPEMSRKADQLLGVVIAGAS